ncbi:hypothetical protein AB7M17_005409 [Bradyrhizobium sp. USDA 377]
MRITPKVHASWVPAADTREINDLAKSPAEWPDSI